MPVKPVKKAEKEPTFMERFFSADLGRKMSPYGSIMEKKATPAMLLMINNSRLPSSQRGNNSLKTTRLEPFLNPLYIMRGYNFIDWVGGFGIMPILNTIQIGLTSLLEIGFRTAGLFLIKPINTLLDLIADKETSAPKKLVSGIAAVLLSPLWFAGQTLALAADVFLYTRQLLDSAMHLVNPLWWATAAGLLPSQYAPSFAVVAKTFLTSALKLLPAAVIITTAILTAGISLPITQALSAPLAALGSTINAAFTALSITASSIATIAANALAATFVAGTLSVAAKFFSACVERASKWVTTSDKPSVARGEDPKSAATKSMSHHNTTTDYLKMPGFNLTANHQASVELQEIRDAAQKIAPDSPLIQDSKTPSMLSKDIDKANEIEPPKYRSRMGG